PFYQRVQLVGQEGTKVRLTAQVDNGAMWNCISLARWKTYGHCLDRAIPSKTRLGVASGNKITPFGRWWGEVSVGGVSASAWFEIFECGNAFDILLGKPWLHSVRASHNYETDEISIHSQGKKTLLAN
ncbi:hypothetical protein C8R45DRAFT_773390, partial [Mycena sanguinolenta]